MKLLGVFRRSLLHAGEEVRPFALQLAVNQGRGSQSFLDLLTPEPIAQP